MTNANPDVLPLAAPAAQPTPMGPSDFSFAGEAPIGFFGGLFNAQQFGQGLTDTSVGRLSRIFSAQGGEEVTEEQFRGSVYESMGLKWRPGITDEELSTAWAARIRAEQNTAFQRRATGAGSVGGLIAQFGGNILDPINLIPFGGGLTAGRAFASTVLRMGAANAGLELLTGVPLEYLARSYEQQSYTFADAAMAVGMGAAVGGVFGAAGYAFRGLRDMYRAMRLPDEAGAPNTLPRHANAPEAPRAEVEINNIRFPNRESAALYNFNRNTLEGQTLAQRLGFETLDQAEAAAAAYRRRVENAVQARGDANAPVRAPDITREVTEQVAPPYFTDVRQVDSIKTQLEKQGVQFSDNPTAGERVAMAESLREAQIQQARIEASRSTFDDAPPLTEPAQPVIDLYPNRNQLRESSVSDWWRRQEGGTPQQQLEALKVLSPQQLDWLLARKLDYATLQKLSDATGQPGGNATDFYNNIRRATHNRGETPPQVRNEPAAEMDARLQQQIAERARLAQQLLNDFNPQGARTVLSGLGDVKSIDDVMAGLKHRYGSENVERIFQLYRDDFDAIARTPYAVRDYLKCVLGG